MLDKAIQVFKVLVTVFKVLADQIFTLADKFYPKPREVSKQIIEMSEFKPHCDDPGNCEYCKKKWPRLHTIYALAFFIIGVITSYAPQYIGTQDNWVINKGDASQLISLFFFIVGICYAHCAYPCIFTQRNAFLLSL